MTLLLKQLFQFLKLLNSDTGTNEISSGIAVGFILGMTPTLSLQTILVIFLILIFRIQIGSVFISAFFFKFIAYILDPIFHWVGSQVLELDSLNALFTQLYNMPIIPFTRFNNSVVMGSGIVAMILSPFIFVLSKVLIKKYRIIVVERFQQTKILKMIKATSLYKWYYKYDNLYG